MRPSNAISAVRGFVRFHHSEGVRLLGKGRKQKPKNTKTYHIPVGRPKITKRKTRSWQNCFFWPFNNFFSMSALLSAVLYFTYREPKQSPKAEREMKHDLRDHPPTLEKNSMKKRRKTHRFSYSNLVVKL